jgi:hypothetical protein
MVNEQLMRAGQCLGISAVASFTLIEEFPHNKSEHLDGTRSQSMVHNQKAFTIPPGAPSWFRLPAEQLRNPNPKSQIISHPLWILNIGSQKARSGQTYTSTGQGAVDSPLSGTPKRNQCTIQSTSQGPSTCPSAHNSQLLTRAGATSSVYKQASKLELILGHISTSHVTVLNQASLHHLIGYA